jgi:hypothetical protein
MEPRDVQSAFRDVMRDACCAFRGRCRAALPSSQLGIVSRTPYGNA